MTLSQWSPKHIANAEQASEVVKEFLTRMGYTILVVPVKAETSEGEWVVVFQVGFNTMEFRINGKTGEIIKYETLQR